MIISLSVNTNTSLEFFYNMKLSELLEFIDDYGDVMSKMEKGGG